MNMKMDHSFFSLKKALRQSDSIDITGNCSKKTPRNTINLKKLRNFSRQWQKLRRDFSFTIISAEISKLKSFCLVRNFSFPNISMDISIPHFHEGNRVTPRRKQSPHEQFQVFYIIAMKDAIFSSPLLNSEPNYIFGFMETRESSHDRWGDSSPLHSPNSPTRALKRLVKSASKNALKFVSPCKHVLGFSPSSPNPAPPKSPRLELQSGGGAMETELHAVFRYFDADGDGKISWQELQNALKSVGEEVGESELRETIRELDSDGDGCIDVDEFIRLNTEGRGREGEEKELAAAFRMFEGREGGGITPAGLHRMMWRLGVGDDALTLDHCSFIISQIDMDGDGVLSFHEFKHMMMATAVH